LNFYSRQTAIVGPIRGKHQYRGFFSRSMAQTVGTRGNPKKTPSHQRQQAPLRTAGEGLPADFDPRSAAGLGMRIVRAFSRQLNAEIAVRRLDPGTEFVVSVRRD
jgi:hypothetical protein